MSQGLCWKQDVHTSEVLHLFIKTLIRKEGLVLWFIETNYYNNCQDIDVALVWYLIIF